MNRRFLILSMIAILCLGFAGAVLASGEGAATLYNQGNALYAKGDFKGALSSYRHALEQRVADPRLEQNIGSAYFKLGQIGQAIFHFRRGLTLAPRNGDLKHDLEHAKSYRKDEVPQTDTFVTAIASGMVRFLTPGEWAFFMTALLVIVCLIFLILMFLQGPLLRAIFLWTGLGFFALMLLFAPFAGSAFYQRHFVKQGVIVAEQIMARTGPDESQGEAFTVHAGMGCEVLEKRGDWLRINIETGLSGWVPAKSLWMLQF